jgi:hypothetical protein
VGGDDGEGVQQFLVTPTLSLPHQGGGGLRKCGRMPRPVGGDECSHLKRTIDRTFLSCTAFSIFLSFRADIVITEKGESGNVVD